MQARARLTNYLRLAALSLVVAGVAAALWWLPVAQWLAAADGWISGHPVSGAALFIGFVVAGSVLLLPGSLLVMCGGYLFGFYAGVAVVSVGTALGSVALCVVARFLARDWLAARYGHRPLFRAIDRAVVSNGFLIVLLTRLSLLIPYSVLNLMYGLTRVSPLTLGVATLIGMLPAVVLYVYIGSVARNVEELLSGEFARGPYSVVLLIVGIVALAAATFVIHRTATRALRRELDQ